MTNSTIQSNFFDNLSLNQATEEIPDSDNRVPTLLTSIINNANKDISDPLFENIGNIFADTYSLPLSNTVEELEEKINQILTVKGLGSTTIDVIDEVAMRITNKIPSIKEANEYHFFSKVMLGIYATWLKQQGGHDATDLIQEESDSFESIVFIYKGRD